MGKNAVESYGAKGRRDCLMLDPNDVVLVEDPKHPLYDKRVHLPIDESMVKNIMVHGVIEPISVRKNGEAIECVVGRQRVKNAREANKRLAKEGKAVIRIPAIIRNGKDADLFGVIISENEIRQDDLPSVRLEKAQRLINYGLSEDEVRVHFRFTSLQGFKNLMALADLSAEALRAVDEGRIGATVAATELSKIPRGEQLAAIKTLELAGANKGAIAKDAVRTIRNGNKDKSGEPDDIRRVPRAKIVAFEKALSKVAGREAEVARAVCKVLLGHSDRVLRDFHRVQDAWKES